MRKILAILVDRANYGRMKPVLTSLQADSDIELEVLCTGTMLLPRFGQVVDIVESDGFRVSSKVYMEIEGSNPTTMSKSIGLGIVQLSTEFERIDPDFILLIGDRYEALAAAISAAYMNLPLAHIQGGEVSGSIDESCRHAITKFSHLHFPSTERAAEYIIRMGESADSVFNVGCPAGDYILSLPNDLKNKDLEGGVGKPIDLGKPYLLVIFHPVTTHVDTRHEVEEILAALNEIGMQTIWLWPNVDAGSDRISSAIRSFRENNDAKWLYLIKNFPPEVFQKVLKNASCAIGNSSSFIRDSTFSGTPVVLVGDRQVGRERGDNLIEAEFDRKNIYEVAMKQIRHGRYEGCQIYGSGNASEQITEILKSYTANIQKTISYVGK
ncbi:UDP-N-acetyl glucosamine 2-epimerase [Shewanella colwelliana]|uniref:UDP-N-acetyl glucosamine 2-epimerase n=1 Tax=Shewanella colwelliana TaxID=23 RepID=A0ABQ4P8C9_SHECO|nr:UDP-N-acetylglucosamine 2-epimerase [Shewanella colwelliana]GIU43391.1 UDP-N-acetyl glucosamine 2-epimerase [Shewanella colwelliana]